MRVNGPGEELERSFAIVDEYLRAVGLRPRFFGSRRACRSFAAPSRPAEPGPRLLFQGHLDVVPAGDGWEFDPFGGDIVDGRLRGRGSCDMKGGVAACVEAICRLATLPVGGPVRRRYSSCLTRKPVANVGCFPTSPNGVARRPVRRLCRADRSPSLTRQPRRDLGAVARCGTGRTCRACQGSGAIPFPPPPRS